MRDLALVKPASNAAAPNKCNALPAYRFFMGSRAIQAKNHNKMTARSLMARIPKWESLNFVVTNYIPRRLATRFMGWFSKIEQPIVRETSLAIWRLFCNLDLSDAKKARFDSLHDCFIRELKDDARPVDSDPRVLVSPCDAIVGSCGSVDGLRLLQVKGSQYPLQE